MIFCILCISLRNAALCNVPFTPVDSSRNVTIACSNDVLCVHDNTKSVSCRELRMDLSSSVGFGISKTLTHNLARCCMRSAISEPFKSVTKSGNE